VKIGGAHEKTHPRYDESACDASAMSSSRPVSSFTPVSNVAKVEVKTSSIGMG
jgi:hypothetical protein